MFKVFLLVMCFSMHLKDSLCSYMGSEASLRQNIADLLDGKLTDNGDNLVCDENELSDTTPKNHSEYDFIVIGAGTAGSVVASRLSEIQNVTVLLIEAGGREYSLLDIPLLAKALQPKNEFSWNYLGERSDEYCLGQQDHKCSLQRGKVMGGSSTTNSFLVTRGNRRDYDRWAREVGDNSWSYRNFLKYFKKLEKFSPAGIKYNKKFHNEDGPLPIAVADNRPKITEAFIEAGLEMGYSEVDYNGFEQIGFSYYQTTIFEGERWSTNKAYLRPAKSRKNLFVTQHSHVHKILIDKVTKTAHGVRYYKNNQIYDVTASKEVILSAGAINSPQILMLSGIGPKKHLRELNIDLIKDASVGEHLLDHYLYDRQLTFTVNDSSTMDVPNILDPNDPSIRDYISSKTGPLSVGNAGQAVSFVNVDNLYDPTPNMRIAFYPGRVWLTKEAVTPDNVPFKGFTMQPMLVKPRSHGKVLLRSNNPFDEPKIYPNYFKDHEDVRVLIKGIKLSMKIGETHAFKRHGAQYSQDPSPCDSHGVGSDDYWECEIRTYVSTVYHYAGTCKMGRETNRMAVVNSKLKVIGIKKLRVADASIMPSNLCAHVYIPIVAIGEKAADLIKMQYGY